MPPRWAAFLFPAPDARNLNLKGACIVNPALKKSKQKAQPRKDDGDFDGFIMPDGEMVPIQNTDRMFSIIVKGRESIDQITEFLWGLAKDCWDSSYFKAAHDYFERILSLSDAPSEKAACLLNM